MYKHHFHFSDQAQPQKTPLSLHDALPIFVRCDPMDRHAARSLAPPANRSRPQKHTIAGKARVLSPKADRKSTRLNSSHVEISYAVFSLKKKRTISQSSSGRLSKE